MLILLISSHSKFHLLPTIQTREIVFLAMGKSYIGTYRAKSIICGVDKKVCLLVVVVHLFAVIIQITKVVHIHSYHYEQKHMRTNKKTNYNVAHQP